MVGRGAAYSKVPGDPYVFFDPDTMKPLINNPGWVQALEDRIRDIEIGPPGCAQWGHSEVRPAFVSGQAAMSLDWGDMGTLSYDVTQSKIKGRCGTALVPGGHKLYNRLTKQWQDTPQVNYAPYLAWTSWLFGVPTKAKHKEAA